MPIEHLWTIQNTRRFLFDLVDPGKTPKVPRSIRLEARNRLKHYPDDEQIEKIFAKAGIKGD